MDNNIPQNIVSSFTSQHPNAVYLEWSQRIGGDKAGMDGPPPNDSIYKGKKIFSVSFVEGLNESSFDFDSSGKRIIYFNNKTLLNPEIPSQIKAIIKKKLSRLSY